MKKTKALLFVIAGLLPAGLSADTLSTAQGADAAAIQATVDSFRASLGTLNSNTAGSVGSGRREINWDGVPAQFDSPNAFKADFFNTNSPRGVVVSTPGTEFQNSSTGDPATARFGNLNPDYPNQFVTFSPQRLFTPVGSNELDVNFFVPGSTTAAQVLGFGAVFTDVDLANTTRLDFLRGGNIIFSTFLNPASNGLSFAGVKFDAPIDSVHIVLGNLAAPGTENPTGLNPTDVVVLDDFIFGEPTASATATPEPATTALIGAGLMLLPWMRKRLASR